MFEFVDGKPRRESGVLLGFLVEMFEFEEAEEVRDVDVAFEVGSGGRCSVL